MHIIYMIHNGLIIPEIKIIFSNAIYLKIPLATLLMLVNM